MRNKLLTSVTLPHHDTRNPAPISQKQRLDALRRLLTDDDIPLLTRVSAILILLYAQPLTRILRLTVDDVTQQDGEVSIRLGDPPIPVPEPFAGLLLEHVGHRLNLTTATNTDARWLFPGRRGGQPMTPDTIARRLRQHGIPALGGRTAALRQLVLQTPAPVVATMLGYTHQQTARLAVEAGSTWSRYAPGDHTRLQDQRTRDS
jgi:integrase